MAIRGTPKTKPKSIIPYSSAVQSEIMGYIKAFSRCNHLLPSTFIINGKEVTL